ncbi:type IV pilus biogenesis/stability protein PilW [Undibacterium squillarum]|uniref:type IV pilus biogenesis/stability protein PilW n=1 Tax=Undibacterium squillarum TaxID=1131567 RepID=UPI0035AFEEB5
MRQTLAGMLMFLTLASVTFSFSGCATKGRLDVERDSQSENVDKAELHRRAAIRLQLAVSYYQQGQYKVALDEIRQALIVAPDNTDAYVVRALVFMEMGEKQLAEDNFEYALKLEPGRSETLNNYGWFLCQSGRERRGLQLLDRVIADSAYPTPGLALNNAGLCSLKLKDSGLAEKYFVRGFKVDPSHSGVNANLAKIYFDRGEFSQARFYIQRVLKQEIYAADVLWLAIKIERKLGDDSAVSALAAQLRKRHPSSKELLSMQKGAFDE